jgi:hypothetical protein
MENYKNLVLKNEIGNAEMIRPIKGGFSIIDAYPLDVVQRLGKYQFIYDYAVTSIFDGLKAPSLLKTGIKKEGSRIGSNGFSKGDVVEVIRFEGSNPVIENPNYKESAPDASKSFWFSALTNPKEFIVPKEYLQKVDDSIPVTIPTGVNFGANPKPQPIYNMPPFKTLPQLSSEVILEENATFVLTKDFQYVSGGRSGSDSCPMCLNYTPIYSTLKAGTKVTGRLFRTFSNQKFSANEVIDISKPLVKKPAIVELDFLAVKGYGNTGSINIPTEYLTRDISNNTNNNSGVVVPATNDNKNLLMIIGAFLVGYVLFNNSESK